ncbi:pyocin S6 family toxin immunity protein [Pseudomonas batumici]|uniref:pyocin S6 family toxin immunity protein n=1 Tax=Pseudomonas batumici TaxID=226910 RepID=UPI00058A4889|nr:pyocin S6 family toxin immunity protein [Pseudomonas batumici]
MYLCITGFLVDDSVDSSLKYELDVPPEFEQAVMDVLGWKNLADECDGDLPLTSDQIQQIASVIKEPLPSDLDLFIGVVRD